MRIVGVNGIGTHGEGNIDVLLAEMQRRGLDTIDVHLPRRHAFSARWGAREDGYRVADASQDGDIVVAHSFGCLRTWHAHRVRDYKAIFLIAPAQSRDDEWRSPRRTHCYYSPGDWVVKLGARLLFHPFGAAGVEGYSQLGPLMHNHRVELPKALRDRHSGYFAFGLLERIADHIGHLAKQ